MSRMSQAQRRFADQAQVPSRLKHVPDPMDELRALLKDGAESIACSLMGEPNSAMSRADDLRFRSKGALSVNRVTGLWYDHETGEGGDMPDLIMRERRCDFTAAMVIARDLLRHPIAEPFRPTAKPPKAVIDHSDLVETIWQQTIAPHGTPVERYLNQRGIDLPADVPDVRFHPACPRGPERHPAMIAAFRDIHSDELCGLHRTFLNADGTKIEGNAKMMIGRVAGAAIKLSPNDQVETGLHIAEGIETALALIGFGFAPAWALGSAGAILNFPVLAGIEALSIGVDQDEAGQKSSAACGARWRSADREVRFIHALAPGGDIADLGKGEPQ